MDFDAAEEEEEIDLLELADAEVMVVAVGETEVLVRDVILVPLKLLVFVDAAGPLFGRIVVFTSLE